MSADAGRCRQTRYGGEIPWYTPDMSARSTDRSTSFWGWGHADRFPDRTARTGMGRMLGAMLGGAALRVREPPTLANVQLPRPRVAIPAHLADIASATPLARAAHTYGKSYRDLVRGFAGDFASAPDFVVAPGDEDSIRQVLDWCADNRVACIPYGGGTSVVGGVEGVFDPAIHGDFAGVVCLSMREFSRVLEVDGEARAARIQAGANGPAIAQQLAPHGLGLRHYPQSFEFSTLGGWLATRAGGHYATVYTHIDDLCESIRMLTPSGLWSSRRLPGSGAGPSPDRMVLGSEGALGVITEAWMRVQKKPRYRANASIEFTDFARAVAATRDIAQSGLFPTNCRLLDSREAMLHQVVRSGRNVLLLGFESADHPTDAWLARAIEIARSHDGQVTGQRVRDSAEETAKRDGAAGATHSWRQAFFDAPYRLNALVSLGVVVDTFETACTWSDFETLHRAVIRAVKDALRRTCGGGLVTCRFTHVYPDGPAPYYTFIGPGIGASGQPDASEPADWLAAWTDIKAAASEAIVASGGTITHHHAVGRVHRPWYDRQRPEPFAAALRAVKRELDPRGILNPGVLVDVIRSPALS